MASERATRALQRAEHTEQGRAEDWLRGWLPVVGTRPDAALAALVGASWTEIGHVLRLTRQGAQRRLRHRRPHELSCRG